MCGGIYSRKHESVYAMKFIKQAQTLPVGDHDFLEAPVRQKHGPLLPDSIRAIICGPSNCGKTNAVISLIEDPNGLKFENVYVHSKSLNQPKYQYLKRILRPPLRYFEGGEVIKPNSIMIFDDVACDKQDAMREYFSMGRHKGVDCFYLCQTYSRIPKQLIRDNANLLVLFKQDSLNLKHAYDDHVGTDMTFDKFRQMCAECWKDKYGFLVIDKDSTEGRYRKGFDCYIST